MVRVDIANRDNVTEVVVTMSVARTHTSHADTTDAGTIVGRIVGECRLCPRDIRYYGTGGCRQRRLFKELASCILFHCHWYTM